MSHVEQVPDPTGPLARFEVVVTTAEQFLASLALAIALLVALYTVAMRAIRVPTGEWVLDLPIELLGVTAIYGAGAMLGRRGHMSVGFIVARFTPRLAQAAALLMQVLMLGLCLLLTSRAVLAAWQADRAGLRQHELFEVPVSWLVWAGAVGFLGWTLHSAFGLVQAARGSWDPGIDRHGVGASR